MSETRKRLLNAAPVRATAPDGEVARPLPPDCPVRPLGMEPGDTPAAVFLSGAGTIAKLSGQQMGQGNLDGLFAPHNEWAWKTWPKVDKKGNLTNLRAEMARVDLMAAAGKRGIWNEMERVRGAGAWRAEDGSLLLHLGDRVVCGERQHAWGEIDGYVYPAGPRMLGPHDQRQMDGVGGPAHELLGMLRTWHWKHPDVAPRLMLGWICAAMVGGALRWRPAVWPTGDRGTGKSSLIEMVKLVLGPNAAICTTNTTAAGIRQVVLDKSVPVLLDEMEASEDGGAAVQRVIELLRQASSGGIGLRGGADHKGAVFQIRSAMLAASIIVPPLRAQDRSRIAILELRPLAEDAQAPAMAPAALNMLGQRLLRRMRDGWPLLAERLETWRAELAHHAGLDARGQDQYGTLLACADVALHDAPPDPDTLADIVGRKCEKSGLVGLIGDLASDDVEDWRRCIDHLLTSAAEVYRGGDRLTISTLVVQAAGRQAGADEDQAQRALGTYGLRVLLERGGWHLAVANQHTQLAAVFARTLWSAHAGASGGWRQTLLRAPGAMVRATALRLAGQQTRVVTVPLAVALGDEAEGSA